MSMQSLMRVMCCVCLVGLVTTAVAASAVDELVYAVVEDIPPDVLAEPGSTVLAEKLAELAAEDLGLEQEEVWDLQARVAEAWLGAGAVDRAHQQAKAMLEQVADHAEWRDRLALVMVEAWAMEADQATAQLAAEPAEEGAEKGAEKGPEEGAVEAPPPAVESVSKRLATLGAFGPEVTARARVLDGQRLLIDQAWELAQAHFDGALEALVDADPRARVPVYSLRVLCMEAAQMESQAILDWLSDRSDDPAVELVLASLLTDSQKLIGVAAPELVLPYMDREGLWRRVDHQGRTLVIYVFATWSQPCAGVTPVVVQVAQGTPNVDFIGLSLDNRDTVGGLDDYKTRYGIQFPVVGEQLGWDGDADDQLHVDAIPQLIVIGPDGRIRAIDLIRKDAVETAKALRKTLTAIQPVENPLAEDDFP